MTSSDYYASAAYGWYGEVIGGHSMKGEE